jgi:tetratricopeptide (TPR) repeat protein
MKNINAIQRILLISSLIFLLAETALATETNPFELGNQAYTAGDFSTAVQQYRKTAEIHGASPSLLYNMGNAYAAMGEPGEAILAYEQALRLDHGNGDIRSSLASLRKNEGLYSEDQPLWNGMSSALGADHWMLIAGISIFLLGCSLFFIASGAKNNRRRIATYTAAAAVLATMLTLPLAINGYQSWNDAVVLTETRLQVSPFKDAASTGAIMEGRIVRPLKKHNEYVLVTDHSGRKGWLKKDNLGFIAILPGTIEYQSQKS